MNQFNISIYKIQFKQTFIVHKLNRYNMPTQIEETITTKDYYYAVARTDLEMKNRVQGELKSVAKNMLLETAHFSFYGKDRITSYEPKGDIKAEWQIVSDTFSYKEAMEKLSLKDFMKFQYIQEYNTQIMIDNYNKLEEKIKTSKNQETKN